MSSLHAANGVYGIFLAFGVDGPECRELRLVHIRQFLTQNFERVEELLAVRGLVEPLTQDVDDRGWRSLRCKNADPEIIFEIVAQLLEGRDVRQRLCAFGARYGEGLHFPRANMRQRDRSRRHEEVHIAAE